MLAGLPPRRSRPSALEAVALRSATRIGLSFTFKVSSQHRDWPARETAKLVLDVLSNAERIGMSKGRYAPFVAEYMAKVLGIEAVQSSESALGGTVLLKGEDKQTDKQVPYTFMRDAEIPDYIARGPLAAGFAGFHQIYGARAIGDARNLRDVPLIRHPSARFVFAAHSERNEALARKLLNGETVTLTTEYVPLAKRIASEMGWSVNFHQSGKGMAEIDAGQHPDWFDGVVAIADTGETLRSSNLVVPKGFDRLAPVDIHFVWSSDLPINDESLRHLAAYGGFFAGRLEDPARQASLNRWLDGRHAERVKDMVAASHPEARAERLPDRA